MKVFFVGAGPGDPELLTLKAAKILGNCRFCIYAGSLVNPQILDLLPPGAEKHDSAKLSLDDMVALFRKAKSAGLDVVRLHTGDPSIYGAIREQMDALDKLGIAYEVVPGVSSFQAAAAALKTELTVPEIAQTVILTRTSDRTPVPAEQEIEVLGRSRATLCIFLSVHKLKEIAAKLIPHYGVDCPAAVVFHASWPDEKIVRGTLKNISGKVAKEDIKKTALIVVGQALARGLPVSKLYDAAFTHGYRRGKRA
jgi:precorrin-4/cobalt-precorrin-4 C11-methyltransferase